MNVIKPTGTETIFDGMVTIRGFGIQHNDPTFNWSLAVLKEEEDLQTPNGAKLAGALSKIFPTERLETRPTILAPTPTKFNGLIVGVDDFTDTFSFYEDHYGLSLIYRGAFADGTRLMDRDEAFAMSSADCALIVVKWRNQVWAAHAGRDSLVDRPMINGLPKSKEYASVVDSIMDEIPKKFHHEAEAFIGYTISAGPHFQHPTTHPEYGESNKKLLEYMMMTYGTHDDKSENRINKMYWREGQFSMKWLLRRQLELYGVRRIREDNRCTFNDTDEQGRHLWFSRRRGEGQELEMMRNFILVTRRY